MKSRWLWLLVASGAIVVVYSMTVLGFVATSPDIGIRCLMVDSPWPNGVSTGVVIRAIPDASATQGTGPKIGDRLVRIGDWPIKTFFDFTQSLMRLRNEPIPPGGASLLDSVDPSELKHSDGLPSLASYQDGSRSVEIEFIPVGGTPEKSTTCYLRSSLCR